MPPHRHRLTALVVVVVLAVLAGCGGGTNPDSTSTRVKAIATTTIFADLVRQVGGDRVEVESLVPKGGEVHTFDPTPSDVRRVTEAQIVFRNGLGLDDWLASLVRDAGSDASVVALGEDLPGVAYLGGDAGRAGPNPHVWMNVAYASLYAGRIADELKRLDPDGAATYDANLAAYQASLASLDEEARSRLAAIPEADRTVVSFHDAFPYFAAAYGLTVDGTVIDAPGQDPSAGEIAEIVTLIRERHVRAIFGEAQFNPALVETIAGETGASVVTDLYTDSVGDPPQDTYESVMRWNLDRVAEALGG